MLFLEYYLIREVEQIAPPQQVQPSTWEKIKKNVIHAAMDKISDTGYALTPGYIASISKFIFEKGGKLVDGLLNKAPTDELGAFRHEKKMDDVGRVTKLFGAAITSAVFYAATMGGSYFAGQQNVQKKLDQANQEFKQQLDVKDQQIADNLAKQAVQAVPNQNANANANAPNANAFNFDHTDKLKNRESPEFVNLLIKKTHEKYVAEYGQLTPEAFVLLKNDIAFFKMKSQTDDHFDDYWHGDFDKLTRTLAWRLHLKLQKNN
jgi:hypothetical protein